MAQAARPLHPARLVLPSRFSARFLLTLMPGGAVVAGAGVARLLPLALQPASVRRRFRPAPARDAPGGPRPPAAAGAPAGTGCWI